MGKGSKPVTLSQLTGRGQIGYTVRRNWRVALAGDQSESETQSTATERQQASD